MFFTHRTHSPRVYLRALRISLLPIRRFSRRVQVRGKSIVRAVGNGLLVVTRFRRKLLRDVFIGIQAGIEQLAALFWPWKFLAFVVPTLFGAGVSAMLGDQYGIAATLYFFSIFLPLIKFITETKNHPQRLGVVSVFVFAAILIFGGSIKWIHHRQLQMAKAMAEAKAAQEQRAVASAQIPSAAPPLTPGPMIQEQASPTPEPLKLFFTSSSEAP